MQNFSNVKTETTEKITQ